MKSSTKQQKRIQRRGRIRAKVIGTPERPRLAVYRSNRYVYAQLIDDSVGGTLGAASSLALKTKGGMRDQAKAVGLAIAKVAKEHKIEKAVFDRGGFLFTGVIKSVADGAREGGLIM